MPGKSGAALGEAPEIIIGGFGIGKGPETGGDGTVAAATPRDLTNWITAEGRLEKIGLYVFVNRPYYFNGPVTYRLYIEYTDHGRNDRSPVVTGTMTPPPDQTVYSWKHDFGNIVQGGTIVADGELPYIDKSNNTTGVLPLRDAWRIRGKNPTKQAIRSRLGSIELQVVVYKESRFRQFDKDGLPLFGPPNGFGVMQLDPPPSKESIWNWKENVDRGSKLFAEKAESARTFPSRVRKKGHPDATDFTPRQLKLETYQRYNGGAYWKWDDTAKKWVVRKSSGYGDQAFAIEKAVLAGNPPADW